MCQVQVYSSGIPRQKQRTRMQLEAKNWGRDGSDMIYIRHSGFQCHLGQTRRLGREKYSALVQVETGGNNLSQESERTSLSCSHGLLPLNYLQVERAVGPIQSNLLAAGRHTRHSHCLVSMWGSRLLDSASGSSLDQRREDPSSWGCQSKWGHVWGPRSPLLVGPSGPLLHSNTGAGRLPSTDPTSLLRCPNWSPSPALGPPLLKCHLPLLPTPIIRMDSSLLSPGYIFLCISSSCLYHTSFNDRLFISRALLKGPMKQDCLQWILVSL